MLENQSSPLSHYSLVMEYADSGTLQSYLKENNLSWNDKFNIAYQLACAVTCLHNEGIVHSDLVTCFLIVILYTIVFTYTHLHVSNIKDFMHFIIARKKYIGSSK